MLKVLEALELSSDYLEKKGIEDPRLNAELMLAHILDCKRLDLYLKFDQPLNDNEKETYRAQIARRGKFEPMQYITGTVEFFGLIFKVSPAALIPRPDTETLVEIILEDYTGSDKLKIFEVGTGTGCIPISLAKNMNGIDIHSIDVSEDAVKLAKENILLHELENVKVKVRDIFELDTSRMEKYDILVSNPPYVADNEYDGLQKEIIDFEPKVAVTDNDDGFSFYRKLLETGKEILKPGGKVYFETGYGMSEQLAELFEKNGYAEVQVVKDYNDIGRVVKGVLR